MKTNQIMIRTIGNYSVQQRTSDGFFDASSLLKSWNDNPNNKKREMNKFFSSSKTGEFIQALKSKLAISQKCDMVNIKVLEEIKGRSTKKGRTSDKVWVNPYLFTKFAMWINPTFEVDVVMFVTDQMIRYRNDAGDAYKELSSAVMKVVPRDFMPKAMQKIGEALNWIIFNSHEKMLRNKHGDENKQRELWQLEKKIAGLIDEGFISTYEQLILYLRKLYRKNWEPKVLTI
ncbi:KilA-N domain-containing protein [Parabacteroides sp. AF48-14]|uniref:KilA-N domain-containing protein n=1 Tax=Parabacteroides sp. AF48-14 TaxID=2292052 RepID=UPI000F008F1A|nr:KilA-N domain-containing protein [Parabacteroides sp. AF48-14]RHO68255.1 KilA-N domain-containing protein [Parabacteroides sp. AF48-14]